MAEKSHSAEAELSQASDSEPREKSRGENSVPVYELGFHVVPTVSEDGVAGVVDKIRAILGKAEIITEHFPERTVLAYTIERSAQGKVEKYTESYFGFIKFATEREALPAIEKALKVMPEILRSLIISTVREDVVNPRRAVFTSTRLEGETIKKPEAAPEKAGEVSEEELDKSIDALVN